MEKAFIERRHRMSNPTPMGKAFVERRYRMSNLISDNNFIRL